MDGKLVFDIYFGLNVIVKEAVASKAIYTALATLIYRLIAAHDARFEKNFSEYAVY
jgi:hypothetical protein